MPTVCDLLTRYIDDYGWCYNWGVVRRMINRTLQTEYTVIELKELYQEMHSKKQTAEDEL